MKLQKRVDKWFHSIAVGRRFTPELKPHKLQLLAVAGLSLLVTVFELARPWPIKWIFDEALDPLDTSGPPRFELSQVIWAGAGAAALIVVLRTVSEYFRTMEMAKVSHQVTRNMRYRIFAHMARLSPLFHARHKSGDLLVRLMGDVPMVSSMLVDSTTAIVTRIVLIVATVVVMLVMDPLLTGAVFLTVPLMLLIVRIASRRITVAVRKQRRKEGDLADYLHEAIAATETIQSLGGSDHVVRRFARNNRRTARAGLKARRLSARLSAGVESLMGVALAGVLFLGSWRVVEGELSPGDLLVFISYVRNLIKPLRSASKHAAKVAKGTACGERILKVLDEEDHVTSPADAPPAPARPRELAFDAITFAYDGERPALTDFSARFRVGELAALVGRSGAGKSTAASLALRLFDPQQGHVRLDGRSLDELELNSMRERVGLCLQRTVLFGDSVRENMLLGRPEASDEEIWQALELAGAAEFVQDSPEGLDAELGAGGVGLSGGQMSRLALARTLLREARVLIVDEPFAGLDRVAAKRVSKTLHALAEERIVVVIAHDLENLELYDRIVFMERGQKVAEGSHAELLSSFPLYREVVRTSGSVGA